MNPILQTIHNRRSVRAYSPEPLKAEEKDAILQATFRSPTAGNMMLYSVLEVEDQALKNRLAETCDHQPFIATAPWVLLFLADYQRWWDLYLHSDAERRCHELGKDFRSPGLGDLLLACCDALIAAQTAVLAAESLGISSCYIGDILERYEDHRQMFDLPRYALPITLVCFGKPAASPPAQKTPRFATEFIVFKNRYHRLSPAELERLVEPSVERYFPTRQFPLEAENFGQLNYLRKFCADFSMEMDRSVREMMKNWDPE